MDVSNAVDTLFGGVVPERIEELKTLWGKHQERVRLLDVDRFLLQMAFGSVQISDDPLHAATGTFDRIDQFRAHCRCERLCRCRRLANASLS